MFCKNCGAEMGEIDRFCEKCGYDRIGHNNLEHREEILEDDEILFKLKPEFNLLYKMITIGGTAIGIGLLIFVSLIAEVGNVIISDSEVLGRFIGIVAVPLAFIIVCYTIIRLIFSNMQYKNLEYNFYKTKLQYKDVFFDIEEKELKYTSIREIVMKQNVLERLFEIGTIDVFTNASSGRGVSNNHGTMIGRNGIHIHCVNNVREQYIKIKEIINQSAVE